MGVFADSVVPYVQAGWGCVLPVPPDTKHPPPVGFTGAEGVEPTPEQLVQWAVTLPDYSVALRMPDGVIGIDVDHYDKGEVQKRGGDHITELETKLGPLPPTWVSSARPEPSGIRFYRVPAGRYRTKLSDSIEIVQRHHRYAVVAPSPHPVADSEYGWSFYSESTRHTVSFNYGPPHLGALAELPAAWVEFLREGASEAGPMSAAVGEGYALLRELEADDREECAEVYGARLKAVAELAASDAGCRHDVTIERVHRLVMLGAAGHPGVGPVLDGIRALWNDLTAGEDRGEEYERMLLTSARKAVTEFGPVQGEPCDCAERAAADAMVTGIIERQGGLTLAPRPTPTVAQQAESLAELYDVTPAPVVQVAEQPNRSRLWNTLLTADSLRGDPPPTPPYVLDGLLREGELAALVSAAKAGKSLLTLDRVLQAVKAGRRVLYLDAENGLYDIHTRVAALGYGGPDTNIDGLIYSSFPSVALDKAAEAADLVAFVMELTEAEGRVDALVFDTASRFLEGAENDAEPWLAMYRQALAPLKRVGIAVLRLDHLGKDETKGARGSSAKSGDVDTVWELRAGEPVRGAVRIELECKMQRSGTHERLTVLSRQTENGVLVHRKDGALPPGAVMPTQAPEREDPPGRIVATLRRLNLPKSLGRERIQEELRLAGVEYPKASTAQWAEAVRRWKGDDDPPVLGPVPKINPRTGENSSQNSSEGPRTGENRTAENRPPPAEVPVLNSCSHDQPPPVEDSPPHPLGGGGSTGPDKRSSRAKLSDEEKAARKEAAGLKRQEEAAAKRATALADAAGPRVELPAVVDRAGNIRSVSVEEAAREVRDATARSGALTVDVETSGRPVGHRDYALRTVQLGDALAAVDFDPTDPAQADAIRELLAEAPRLHAFSASADLVPLIVAGLADQSIWDRMYDVVIPAKLADPQSTGSDAEGLKGLAGDVLGPLATAPAAEAAKNAMFKAGGWLVKVKPDTPLERNGWAQVDSCSSTMVRYAASDVLDTAALALKLPWPDAALLERERTAAEMTSRVTHRGVRLDAEQVATLKAEHTSKLNDAAERVRTAGVSEPGSDKELAAKLISLDLALPRTQPSKTHPDGQPSVARDVLDGLGRTEGPWSELLTAVLDYRKSETALGLFLGPYWDLIQNGDGRARPTIYTLAADTGRMSGARPNPQQVTQTGGFRACWVADPGYRGISADFSSVELRCAAALSQDPSLMRYIEEEDAGLSDGLHWAIAREVWGPEATKADRYRAKRIVFGRLYGGGVPTLAKQSGVSESVAASAVDVIDALAPGLARWSDQTRQSIRRGQRQFEIYSGATVYVDPAFPHKGPNFRIQRTARELLVDALVRWRQTRWGTCTLLPVHDELIVFVPEDEAKEATAELVRCMESELFGVKIKVEADDPWVSWPDAA